MLRRTVGWLVLLFAVSGLRPAQADVITDWNAVATIILEESGAYGTVASRAYAMLHLAMFDAVNGITRAYDPYLVREPAPRGASPEAAAATAGFHVLRALYPEERPRLEMLLARSLSAVPERTARQQGIDYGQRVAEAVLAARENDGSDREMTYTPPERPGQWRPTPPDFHAARYPQWAHVRPFTMTGPAQFRPGPPLALDSEAYARDVNEVKALGGRNSQVRTPDQTEIALFWLDPPVVERWNLIAQQFTSRGSRTVAQNARLYALLNAALADAAIAAWDSKFHYGFWRPVTAIRQASQAGNPRVPQDPVWEPYLPTTPSYPDYVPAVPTFNGAAAAVLAHEFGDRNDFPMSFPGPPALTRSYHSFSEAAQEGAMARVYEGIHFRYSVEAGLSVGGKVGEQVWSKFLQPAR